MSGLAIFYSIVLFLVIQTGLIFSILCLALFGLGEKLQIDPRLATLILIASLGLEVVWLTSYVVRVR